MESSSVERQTTIQEPLLESNIQKGGFRILPFIIATEALEKMATYGLTPNMILYLMREYHLEMTSASNILYLWSSATNFMPIVGAILADSYFGRFYVIGLGTLICFMGTTLLWLTTVIPQARPSPCNEASGCGSSTSFQLVLLYSSFALMSIGAGGIRSSSLAFGADQLERGNSKRTDVMGSYFSWYYASYTLSILIAITCVVYIQDNMGWEVGFSLPAVFMLISALIFFSASPFYVKLKGKTSLVAGFFQVLVASYRNRHLKLSSDGTNFMYHYSSGSTSLVPSEKLRFLNKACVIKDPQKDTSPNEEAMDPWSLCTVDQVEELKALLRVIPIWSTGMIMSVNICQNSFPVLQASSMARNITSGFKIPAGSFSVFTVISVILWIAVYDRVFLPVASRIKGRPIHVNPKVRMGIGIFLSFLAMLVTTVVERIRRSLAIKEGRFDDPQSTLSMSAMWLVPQYCLSGFAEASDAVAENEFFFSEFPRTMWSIATTLNGLGMAVANLLASFILTTVDNVSRRGQHESWISSNINKGHYDYYYLVLAGLSMVNMIYFLICSRSYGPCKEKGKLRKQDGNNDELL